MNNINASQKEAENSILLVDALMQYSEKMYKSEKTSCSQISAIGRAFKEINIGAKNNENLKKIKEYFNELPIFRHSNALNLFIKRFQQEILENEEKSELSQSALAVEDELMNYAQAFEKNTKRIPSPFEVLFLYFESEMELKNQTFIDMLCKNDFQYRVLSDFVGKFQAKYDERLNSQQY